MASENLILAPQWTWDVASSCFTLIGWVSIGFTCLCTDMGADLGFRTVCKRAYSATYSAQVYGVRKPNSRATVDLGRGKQLLYTYWMGIDRVYMSLYRYGSRFRFPDGVQEGVLSHLLRTSLWRPKT